MRPELETIYQTAPIGLAVLDTELRFLRINERLAEINGVAVEDHLGRTVAEVLPGVATEAEAMLRRVIETGEPLRDWELRGETPARPGVERIWLEQVTPLCDQDGKIVRLIVVAQEVTERRQAEEALRKSQANLAIAMEAAGLALWEWDIPTNVVRFGANWEHILGVQPRARVAARDEWRLELIHPDDLPQTSDRLKDHLAGRTPVYECEYRMRHARGDWIWVSSRGRVIDRDEEGRPVRMMGVVRDITEQRSAHQHLETQAQLLRQSQERLAVALDAGRMGVWDWSTGSPTAYWSPEVYKLLGLTPETDHDPEPFGFLQRVHPDDRAKLDAEIARVLTKGGDYESEFRVVRADGETRWLVSRGRVSHDGQQPSSRLVGVNFDITERKLVEQALREADARRNEFLAMLAHELRNPLAPIANAVRLLEKIGDSPDRREVAVQILRRQTSHMARLVDDLLEMSRITQGRIELRMENVLVATSVFQAIEAVRGQAKDRHQTIDVDVPAALDLVADPARLTQIISNLVTNAVKYTPEGGRIVIKAESETPDVLSIIVRDNGPGISDELRPKIFELFTQDRRTLDRSQGGLGIGLALVKQLTELHGGRVRCESDGPGTGARFVVCLPRGGRREEIRGSPGSAIGAPLSPLPILVVDDNVDAAETLASLLRLDGHRVEVAFDGEHALAAALWLRPRVVLLDLGLPKLDGLAVARRLRQDDRFERCVLIAMSGYAQASDREATAAAGFDAHLAKPLALEDVYASMAEAGRV